MKLTCLLCGRDTFTRKTPHNCIGGYKKRGLSWGLKVSNGMWKRKYDFKPTKTVEINNILL
jgi:hypothetical protein